MFVSERVRATLSVANTLQNAANALHYSTVYSTKLFDAVENRLTDVFPQFPIRRRQRKRTRKRVRLRKRLLVFDRELNAQVPQIRPPVTFRQMHGLAVRLAGRVQP